MMDTFVIGHDHDKLHILQTKVPWKFHRVLAHHTELSHTSHGCILCHRNVWERVVKNNEGALVLEEDCHFKADFETQLTSLIQTLPSDYDIAVLGYLASDIQRDYLLTAMNAPFWKRRCMKKINQDWFVPGYFMGSHCYLITPRGAQTLLTNPSFLRTDLLMNVEKNLVLYCPRQSIATMTHATQTKSPSMFHYNPHLHVKQVMLEPVGRTVKQYHLSLILLFMIVFAVIFKSKMYRNVVKIVVVILFIHYLSTVVHVSHNLQRNDDTLTETTRMQKRLHELNDLCMWTVMVLLLWLGIRNHVLIELVDLFLLYHVIRVMMTYRFPLQDPSGFCEEKSVAKYSFLEYCGTLRVSGHIFPSIVLMYFMPPLGVFFFFLQTLLILLSKSHYFNDIVLGICISVFVIYMFQIIRKKRFQCKQKNKCLL